jgi:hypothetical protein
MARGGGVLGLYVVGEGPSERFSLVTSQRQELARYVHRLQCSAPNTAYVYCKGVRCC